MAWLADVVICVSCLCSGFYSTSLYLGTYIIISTDSPCEAESVEWEILNVQSELCGCSKHLNSESNCSHRERESGWLNGTNQ